MKCELDGKTYLPVEACKTCSLYNTNELKNCFPSVCKDQTLPKLIRDFGGLIAYINHLPNGIGNQTKDSKAHKRQEKMREKILDGTSDFAKEIHNLAIERMKR